MDLTGGFILLSFGLGLLIVGTLRRGPDIRLFLRSDFAWDLYPVLCLGLITFGVAFITASLLGPR